MYILSLESTKNTYSIIVFIEVNMARFKLKTLTKYDVGTFKV